MALRLSPIACVFAALLLPAIVAHAQPSGASRVLKTIDFEERHLGNAEALPMFWTKAIGPGLPHYLNGHLATDQSHDGRYSFRFDLNGGSLIYQYDPAQAPVRPGAHYRVETWVRTTPMPHARVRLAAHFLDQDGHAIAGSLVQSEPYAATSSAEGWRKLGVELSADPDQSPAAAFLVVELALLQPDKFAPATLGPRTLHAQDVHGTAWFDDVTISQVPRVTMTTDRPGNVFRLGEEPRLHVLVNDRFTDDLSAQLLVQDAVGQTVYQRSGATDVASAHTLGPGRKRFSLDLPALAPGWYRASLVMTSQRQYVGEQTLDFVLLADAGGDGSTDPRFGLMATDLPLAGWSELPRILPLIGAGRIKLAVWSEAGDAQRMDPQGFDALLERLQSAGITPTACLNALPPEDRATGSTSDPAPASPWSEILTDNAGDWRGQLAYLISRHANHLDRWQLGADGSDAFVRDPRMRSAYDLVYREFKSLVQHPDLAMPWPAWHELDGRMPATVALSVPATILPSQLPLYVQDLVPQSGAAESGRAVPNLSLTLGLLDRAEYGRDAQVRDLVQRVVYALASGAQRIDLPLPFTVSGAGKTLTKQPQELLMVIRTLVNTLGGTTFKGKTPIADGVEAFLFERDADGKGILVLWDQGNTSGVKQLALDLGRHPRCLDPWGNARPLLRGAAPGPGTNASGIDDAGAIETVALDLGPMPVFLIDIDGKLAQLRASVALDRPLLESSFEPHLRKIRFTNPYPQAIGGSLKLRAPAGWTINPPTFDFTLNPGETFDREVTIEFPYNSFAGAKAIRAEFIVQADRTSAFAVPILLKLGLSDVGMQSLALRDGDDVVVQQIITNYGEHPVDYTGFAIIPGQARQERLVTNLAPGRTTLKRYRFASAAANDDDVRVRCGLRELNGPRVLNEELAVR